LTHQRLYPIVIHQREIPRSTKIHHVQEYMKIYFIEAERDKSQPPTSNWFDPLTHKFSCPSLGPLLIASLTPKNIEVRIIDEKIEEIQLDDLPDAVAISFKTMSSRRAYELAGMFREKQVKVILGGIHASLLPEEAKSHCDSVVIGEAEEVWPSIIDDLQHNQLRPSYRMPQLTDLLKLGIPRYELLQNNGYICHSIQTSRGCSLNCDFCPTREMFGGVFRTKSVKQVLQEIQEALSIEKKYIFFTDDIFGAGDETFTMELLQHLKKLKIEFFVISDFLVLNKNILLALARSGCRYIALNMPGTCSKREVQAIKMIQRLGIDVWGYFMFGFRFHEKDVFKKVFDFVNATHIKHVSLTVMTPYPNTFAGRELDKQGRNLSKEWTLYDNEHVVFEPENMKAKDLEEGFNWIRQKISYLVQIRSDEDRSIWKIFTGRCLAGILAMLPSKSRKSSERPQ
jgi:radical SAM superfamily enzyme YgiQ (UPF0313 family)